MNFHTAYINEILKNINNYYLDNVDIIRYPDLKGKRYSPKNLLKKLLSYFNISYVKTTGLIQNNLFLDKYWQRLEQFYELLKEDQSKNLLVKLLAYRFLGGNKVKLDLNNNKYWEGIAVVEKDIINEQDFIQVGFNNWKLYKANLDSLGFPLQMYFNPIGIYTDFVLKQYEYHSSKFSIEAQKGDVVIDAGGCWGDTALYFASKVEENGQVICFEFIPSNLKILNGNIQLNQHVKENIKIIEKPLWELAGRELYYKDYGPASKISFTKENNNNNKTITTTIDETVKIENIAKVHFIKMDIEGAELHALKGAIETIKRDKPVLAIAVYHSLDDLVEIPAYINSLNLGYNFYLNHYTIHLEETILFATVKN